MKRLSLILFCTWSVLLVLILTFGTGISTKISKFLSNTVNENNVKLKDVIIELDDYYPIENTYTLKYSVKPLNDEDYGICFTSLDEDIFSVDGKKIKGNRLDTDSNTGRLKITSTKYPDFEKIVEVTFKKVYPTDFDFKVYPGANKKETTYNSYLGVPMFVTLDTVSDKTITELECEFICDNQYFDVTKVRKNYYKLVAKYNEYQPGDDFTAFDTTISYIVNGIKKDYNVTINPSTNPANLDDIYLANSLGEKLLDQENIYIGDHIRFNPVYQGKNRFDIPYQLTSSNEAVIKIDELDNIVLVGPGDATISYTLYNGKKYDFNIHLRNHLVLPTINADFDSDGRITLKSEARKKIEIIPNGSSKNYEVSLNAEHIYIENKEINDKIIYLTGYEGYTGTLKIVVDDGIEHLEKEYEIIVLHNDKAPSVIKRVINTFVHKIAGHMAFFVLEAILGFWCFMNYHFKKEWLNIICFLYIGLFIALLTEFIQKFMPGRTSRMLDVLIDMSGYIVGYLLSLVVYLIGRKIKKGRDAKNAQQENI